MAKSVLIKDEIMEYESGDKNENLIYLLEENVEEDPLSQSNIASKENHTAVITNETIIPDNLENISKHPSIENSEVDCQENSELIEKFFKDSLMDFKYKNENECGSENICASDSNSEPAEARASSPLSNNEFVTLGENVVEDELSQILPKIHYCPICNKAFKASQSLSGHVVKRHNITLGEEKYTCHVCGQLGSSRSYLKRHLIRTHKIMDVDHPELLTKKCQHCNESFATYLDLNKHIRSLHEDKLDEYFCCIWCPTLMKAKGSLVRHVRRAHPGKKDSYSVNPRCPVCHIELPNTPAYQRHMKHVHQDYMKQCPICNASFKYSYLTTRHIKTVHQKPPKPKKTFVLEMPQTLPENPPEPLVLEMPQTVPEKPPEPSALEKPKKKRKHYSVTCDRCEKSFCSKIRLINHLNKVHPTNPEKDVNKRYTCSFCPMAFESAKKNKYHYRNVHLKERLLTHCSKCNITFETKEECDAHRAVHPAVCEVCQKQFLKRESLREHMLIHSEPRHKCPHCEKKFTQRSNLKRHIRVHTGEKPFQCPYCSRGFSDRSACNSHMRIHTGYEKSVCNICGAAFSKKQKLNYHMRIHSGEGLLYCPLCKKASTTAYALRKHVETHTSPLTKALTSTGFSQVLTANPNFVKSALINVTEAYLLENAKNDSSFKFVAKDDCGDDINTLVETLNTSSGSSIPALNNVINSGEVSNNIKDEISEDDNGKNVNNKNDVSEDLTNFADNCGDISNKADYSESISNDADNSENINNVTDNSDNQSEAAHSSSTNENYQFNFTSFLQNILEKETKKIISKKRVSKRKKRVKYNENSGGENETYYSKDNDDELPDVVGDELVQKCLEIVIKDEPASENDDQCSDYNDDDDYNNDFNRENSELNNELINAKVKSEHWENFGNVKCEMEDPNLSGIPKIKISKINIKIKSDSNPGIFVSTLLEN